MDHHMRTLASDLIGPYGGPRGNAGFRIGVDGDLEGVARMTIGAGRYYVDGLMVENPTAAVDGDALPAGRPLLVYLEVWERLVTAVEAPGLRDVALGAGGPDTAATTTIAWRVVATRYVPGSTSPIELEKKARAKVRREALAGWSSGGWRGDLGAARAARLRARAWPDASQGGGYHGGENRVYRVEVHGGEGSEQPTFRWSRDCGSSVAEHVLVAGSDAGWLDLEDGVQVQFAGGPYRCGDYWLIPARADTADVVWPATGGEPAALPPDGPTYRHAPLALLTKRKAVDLCCLFDRLPLR
jgi:hypothetical protein